MSQNQIRDYEIEGIIGRGGMGSVYKAIHKHLGTLAAIKILHEQYADNPQINLRFLNEARLLHSLRHPNIVELREFFEDAGRLVLVEEYVEGRSLDRMIGDEVGPIPWEKALPLFIQLLEGVGYAHSRGVVHRDIKPSNILVSVSGEVKITDFGIAKIAGQKGLTKTGTQLGTLYYESPEQVKGARDVDHRSDIYALGMTLYEMLAGRLPFDTEGDTSEFQVMNSIVNRAGALDPREFYPHIPEWLVAAVQKATELEASDRYATCEAFLRSIGENSNLASTESGYWSGRVAAPNRSDAKAVGPSVASPVAAGSQEVCPECGSRIGEAMEFCGKCGSDLQQECPSCHQRVRWFHEYCPKCGANIERKRQELAEEAERRRLEEERLARERKEKRKQQEEAKRLAEEKHHEQQEALKKQEAERRRLEKERLAREIEEKLKRQEEWKRHAEEIFREQQALKRQESEKRIEWWGRHWWKIAAVVLVSVGSIWYLQSDVYAYSKAEKLFGAGNYHESALAFQALGEYRDSEEQANESIYREAEVHLGASDTTTAVQLFDSIRTYSDSENRISLIIIPRLRERMTFVQVPSGSFSMGSPTSESDRYSNEGPVHTVSVQSFELMTTEVTQGLWEEVMGSNPAIGYGVGSSYPVYSVSWNGCQEFINQLNSLDTEYEYRLPTEAEWEYACRSGTTTAYYWGDSMNGSYCWYIDNSSSTNPVAQKLPNAWGLYDMSGNVWEWCEDCYHISYSGAPTNGSAWLSQSNSNRVNRGGSWLYDAQNCRSANRVRCGPGYSDGNLGLRLARSAR